MDIEGLYPKVTTEVSSPADRIADEVTFRRLASGALEGFHAAMNSGMSVCIDDKPLDECAGAKQAAQSTMGLLPKDTNDGFTGWIGYSRASATCEDCGHGCSAKVFWEVGAPTERMRFQFYEKPKHDTVLYIGTKRYRS